MSLDSVPPPEAIEAAGNFHFALLPKPTSIYLVKLMGNETTTKEQSFGLEHYRQAALALSEVDSLHPSRTLIVELIKIKNVWMGMYRHWRKLAEQELQLYVLLGKIEKEKENWEEAIRKKLSSPPYSLLDGGVECMLYCLNSCCTLPSHVCALILWLA